MDFKVTFYGKYSQSLIDYSQIQTEGVEFFDKVKALDPKYRNLKPKDIRYVRCRGHNFIGNTRYEMQLSLNQARETGHFKDCNDISVAIEGRFNEYHRYEVEEYWGSNFFLPFIKKLEWINVNLDVCEEEIYAAWKAAGFPKSWKI